MARQSIYFIEGSHNRGRLRLLNNFLERVDIRIQ